MSVYTITIPCFAQMLRTLTTLLRKGEEHAQTLGFDAQHLLDARLAPDMHTLARQVEFTCAQAQEAVCRLTQQPLPALVTPANMPQARVLIEDTLAMLASADRAAIDAGAQQPMSIALAGGLTFDMTGQEYAVNWATPQFYFHLVTAYNILRHNGVPLGKAEYVQHMFAYARQP
ncbi:DUF1993 domain-containing protein [Janthinobacterium violaceinigrum]|uniref:DUF1993 family protein n=1 Tax=Janthinobacterium violaceinigrum TaxID=2654252 RepID=A0A6I1IHB2_9BURK|nr:DUF1993 domain-containing protein [Janthinobacterium violaceinigrum]KAB8063591.1 DUF1993 family protein [Janthinobacterium violaceinigrum]